jgi:hypothetical protein
MHIHRHLRLLCIFNLYANFFDAQEHCRFPVEFDNFNSPASWNTSGNNTYWRKLAFGINASEAWTLEFKVHLEESEEIQNVLVGLVNDSDISECGNIPLQGNLCFSGLALKRIGKTDKEWIAVGHPADNRKNVIVPETCFLRFECQSLAARLTAFRDEELTDTIQETSQTFRLNYSFRVLNSFFIQFDPSPAVLHEIKIYISELRFFNGQPLSFPILSQSDYPGKEQSEVELVPNPNQGIFSLHLPAAQDKGMSAHVEIYNSVGGADYKLEYTGNNQQMELGDAKPGLYLLKLYVNGTTILRKFIIY